MAEATSRPRSISKASEHLAQWYVLERLEFTGGPRGNTCGAAEAFTA
jgi:hypothetical protein